MRFRNLEEKLEKIDSRMKEDIPKKDKTLVSHDVIMKYKQSLKSMSPIFFLPFNFIVITMLFLC